MKFTSSLIALVISATAVLGAFQHDVAAADGVYTHTVDPHGNVHTEYLGPIDTSAPAARRAGTGRSAAGLRPAGPDRSGASDPVASVGTSLSEPWPARRVRDATWMEGSDA